MTNIGSQTKISEYLTNHYSTQDLLDLATEIGVHLDNREGRSLGELADALLDRSTANGQIGPLELRVLRRQVAALESKLQQERAGAESRRLARIAQEHVKLDPERSILIGLEACAAAPTFEARDALQHAVVASHIQYTFHLEGDTKITHAYFTGDNRSIMTGGIDGSLRWWDSGTGQELHALFLSKTEIKRIVMSPNRELAVVYGQTDIDGLTVRSEFFLVDCINRSRMSLPGDIVAYHFYFSDNADRLACSDENNHVTLLDTRTHTVLARHELDGSTLLGISHDTAVLATDAHPWTKSRQSRCPDRN